MAGISAEVNTFCLFLSLPLAHSCAPKLWRLKDGVEGTVCPLSFPMS